MATEVRRSARPAAAEPVRCAQASAGTVVHAMDPGATLRRRREDLGLPLEELVAKTRIRCIPEIEAERFEALPTEVHVRSHVGQYARALGIPQREQLVERYLVRYREARSRSRAAGAGTTTECGPTVRWRTGTPHPSPSRSERPR